MNAGATPKHRKSARLSNSAPNREVAFSSRAMRPSSPSMQAADDQARRPALPQRWSRANRIAVSPAQRPSIVIRFGIIRLNDGPLIAGTAGGRVRPGRKDRMPLTSARPSQSHRRPSSAPPPPGALTPSGRYRSVRLPKRMMPNRAPGTHACLRPWRRTGSAVLSARRSARRRNPGHQAAVAPAHCARSSSLALSRLALTKAPWR